MKRDAYFYHNFFTGLNACITRNVNDTWTLLVTEGYRTMVRKTVHASHKGADSAWLRMCRKRMKDRG